MFVSIVIAGLLARLSGWLGTNTTRADPPTCDTAEEPYLLVAITLAWIVCPRIRLNGAAYSAVSGTVHCCVLKIVEVVPSQLVRS